MIGKPARLRLASLIVATSLVVPLLLPVPALAEKTLGVSSGTFKYELSAGDTAQGQVILSNDGDEDITVLVYAADQKVSPEGAIDFVVPSRGDISSLQAPSAWVRLGMPADSKSFANVPYVQLSPGDKVPIDFEVTVPNGVPPGDHNVMVFFEMAELPDDAETTQMRVSGRIGSRITLRVNGELVERADVRPFTVPSLVFSQAIPFEFTINNSGNVDQRMTAKAALLDRNEATVSEALPIEAQIVFAGRGLESSGTVSAGKYAFGPHTVRLEVTPVDDLGAVLDAGKNAMVSTRTVWVLPIWFIVVGVVLILVILGVVATLITRSGKKRRAQAAAAASQVPTESDQE